MGLGFGDQGLGWQGCEGAFHWANQSKLTVSSNCYLENHRDLAIMEKKMETTVLCRGKAARQILRLNAIDETEVTKAIYYALHHGRAKGHRLGGPPTL